MDLYNESINQSINLSFANITSLNRLKTKAMMYTKKELGGNSHV